jgi:rhodanese-related sulfurtransferase
MKKTYSLLVFIFLVTGCMFQRPEYLKVIRAAELNQIMQHEDIFLVDVHMPRQRPIKGTDLVIPFNEIEQYGNKFPDDKDTAIYLYCESGAMGNAAARSLYELGYRNLINLEGGTNAWIKSGFNVEP